MIRLELLVVTLAILDGVGAEEVCRVLVSFVSGRSESMTELMRCPSDFRRHLHNAAAARSLLSPESLMSTRPIRNPSKRDGNQLFSLMSRTLTRVTGLEIEDDDSSCESENQMTRTWRPTSEDEDDSDDSDDGEKEEEYERLSSGMYPFIASDLF